MATKGTDRISVSVSNLEDSLALYRDWIGMKVVADEALEPNEIHELWNLPQGTEARAVFLKQELQPTLLELIEFKPHSGKTFREPTSFDYGFLSLAFRVKDNDAIYRGLTEKGFAFVNPPMQYKPDWIPYTVSELLLIAPEGYLVSHFNLIGEEYESQGNYIKFDHCAQYVDNISKGIKFYRDILGLDLRYEIPLSEGVLNDVLRLPLDTKIKVALIHKKDENALTMQFIQLSVKGNSLASVARPPNLGLFMISYEVDDLSSLIETFKKEGIAILSGPVELHTKLHGKMRAITVEGPYGEMVELFER